MIPSRKIWLVDFEFHQPDGEVPHPICMVARNFATGETIRMWLWDEKGASCPVPLDPETLYVAFMASAELGCHLALGWSFPVHVLDLSAEFRLLTSGRTLVAGKSLLGALTYYGVNGIDAAEKKELRELAMRGGPFSVAEKAALLDYCESDVVALSHLLAAMLPSLDLPRALIRGRYMKAVSRIERTGIPIAVEELQLLRNEWNSVQRSLVSKVDLSYGVYEGTTLRRAKFLDYCDRSGIRWPRLETGQPCLKGKVFRQMALLYSTRRPTKSATTSIFPSTGNSMTTTEIPYGSSHQWTVGRNPIRRR